MALWDMQHTCFTGRIGPAGMMTGTRLHCSNAQQARRFEAAQPSRADRRGPHVPTQAWYAMGSAVVKGLAATDVALEKAGVLSKLEPPPATDPAVQGEADKVLGGTSTGGGYWTHRLFLSER
jgi:hypothetical protein